MQEATKPIETEMQQICKHRIDTRNEITERETGRHVTCHLETKQKCYAGERKKRKRGKKCIYRKYLIIMQAKIAMICGHTYSPT